MTSEMREYVERNIESSKGNLTVEYAKQVIAQKEREISYWEDQYVRVREKDFVITRLKSDINYFKSVIEVLEEMQEVAELEAVTTTVQEVISEISSVSKITLTRKAVAKLANRFKKLGYSLSKAFKKAWRFVKAMFEPQAKYRTDLKAA